MWGDRPSHPAARLRTPQLVAGALLALSAVLAVGGSFCAFFTRRVTSNAVTSIVTADGWGYTMPEGRGQSSASAIPGAPLVIAGALALAAALVLALRARRPGDAGRLFGIAAAGLLVGVIAPVATEVAATVANTGIYQVPGDSVTVTPGLGTWLMGASALAALAVVGLLLVPAPEGGKPASRRSDAPVTPILPPTALPGWSNPAPSQSPQQYRPDRQEAPPAQGAQPGVAPPAGQGPSPGA